MADVLLHQVCPVRQLCEELFEEYDIILFIALKALDSASCSALSPQRLYSPLSCDGHLNINCP